MVDMNVKKSAFNAVNISTFYFEFYFVLLINMFNFYSIKKKKLDVFECVKSYVFLSIEQNIQI